jgi:FkbM family methyltransferase
MNKELCRKDTNDIDVYNEVYVNNIYNLKDMTDKIVIDAGAHVGYFTKLCLDKGAKFVYALEANKNNYNHGCKVLFMRDNHVYRNIALWRSDRCESKLYCSDVCDFGKTDGNNIIYQNNSGEEVATIGLDMVITTLANKYGKVDLLKIDCEGSEFPILYTSQLLKSIPLIVGEYHSITGTPKKEFNTGHPNNIAGLKGYLEDLGYSVTYERSAWGGTFEASK